MLTTVKGFEIKPMCLITVDSQLRLAKQLSMYNQGTSMKKTTKDIIIYVSIFVFTGLLASSSSYGKATPNCVIRGYKIKTRAKTAYIGHVKFSSKQQSALAKQCTMYIKTMTRAQRKALLKAEYQAKFEKLK